MKKKILIVNVNWIGDVLFSTPFVKAVRQAYPDSYIACLLHPRCKEILDGNPRLDEIIIYDEEGRHRNLFGKFGLIMELRKKKFDTAFILHRSFTKALITLLAGIKERIGYSTKNRAGLLTEIVEAPAEDIHKVEYFLNIARFAGIETPDTSYEFFIKDIDRGIAKEMLVKKGVKSGDVIISICPGGNWDPKRWPKENFAALSDSLAEKFGARIVITGAKKDAILAGDIERLMKNKPVNIAGETNLKQLGAIFENSALVVANDTGSMHLAVAVGAKVIALFGPTAPRLTGPYGKGNYIVVSNNDRCEVPCYDVTCVDNSCMKAISVESMLKAAEAMLTGRRT